MKKKEIKFSIIFLNIITVLLLSGIMRGILHGDMSTSTIITLAIFLVINFSIQASLYKNKKK